MQSQPPAVHGESMTVGLLHHTGGGNLGDESTQAAGIQNIRRRWPHASIVGLTMNPDDTRARHGIPSYAIRRKIWDKGCGHDAGVLTPREETKRQLSKYPFLFVPLKAIYTLAIRMPRTLWQEIVFLIEAFRIVRSLDLLIVNGGGQLTGWGGPWEFTYTVFKWVCLARLAHIRCYILNIGVGPLTDPISKFFARRALSCADYVSFRDRESQTLARQIGYTGRSEVFPDSVYSLEIPALRSARSVKGSKPIVGVAPMVPYSDSRAFVEKDQGTYDKYIRKLARFTAQLIINGCAVALLAGDIGVDPLAVEDLQRALEDEGITASCGSLTTELTSSSGELLSRMATLDYVVVSRFHGVVFAHLLNTPVLALSHHPKVAALMSDLGLARYCVDIRTFDDESLMQTFQALVNDQNEIRGRMAETLGRYRGRLTEQFDELFPPETT